MAGKLTDAFKARVAGGSKRPLVAALYDTYRSEFLLAGLTQLIASVVQILSPFALKYLIKFAAEAYVAHKINRPGPAIGRGIGFVLAIFGMQVIQSICISHSLYRSMMVGGQARSALIAVIFDKALKISRVVRGQ